MSLVQYCIAGSPTSSHVRPRPSGERKTPELAVKAPAPSRRPDQVVSKNQQREQVREVLDTLPPDYRAAVVLRYWYGLSYREIATAMKTTESAIKSRLHRARRMMAQELQAA